MSNNKVISVKKEGYYLSAYDNDALLLGELLDYTVFELGNSGRMKTGFPAIGLDTVTERLKMLGYDLITDIPNPNQIERTKVVHKGKAINYYEFCNGLLNGIDTRTGEILDMDNIILSSEVQVLLRESMKALKHQKKGESTSDRNGKPWDNDEIEQLKKEYLNKIPINELSKIHRRTSGAIRVRLLQIYPEIVDNQ